MGHPQVSRPKALDAWTVGKNFIGDEIGIPFADFYVNKLNAPLNIGILAYMKRENEQWSESVQQSFHQRKLIWLRESGHLSRIREKVGLMSYLRIIALGRDVVPLLINELRIAPRWWFTALEALTGENPVADDHVGDIQAMSNDWLQWWEDNGRAWMKSG